MSRSLVDFHWKLLRDYTCLHCCRVVLVYIVHCDFFRLMMFLVQSGSMHGGCKSEGFAGCACFWRAFLKFLVWITLVVHLVAVSCAYIFLFLMPNTRTDRIYLKHWGQDYVIKTHFNESASYGLTVEESAFPVDSHKRHVVRAPAPRQPSAGRNSHTFSSSTTRVEISFTSTMQKTT